MQFTFGSQPGGAPRALSIHAREMDGKVSKMDWLEFFIALAAALVALKKALGG
ncbi:hypothetical protein [Devosia sediminis]|uniref:Uncharacterized protein n=1 Tax=Devosia sediminis TaxID=2798801 RepID=A0A934J2A8_9HYPH|nr:hypothetical protein [Devosia sediminis]MBJ3786359.1 hypothetical protein [Devosia sediminis]